MPLKESASLPAIGGALPAEKVAASRSRAGGGATMIAESPVALPPAPGATPKNANIPSKRAQNLALQRRIKKAEESEAARLQSMMVAQQVQNTRLGTRHQDSNVALGQTAVTAALCGDADIGAPKLTVEILRKHEENLSRNGSREYKLGRNASEVLFWKKAVQQSLKRQFQR